MTRANHKFQKRWALLWVWAILAFIFDSQSGMSADINEIKNDYCEFELRGIIYPGDFDRFVDRGFFADDKEAKLWKTPIFANRLCLNSPGGSIIEGLRLFEGIWNTGIVTIVAPDMRCESACALAFLGGSSFEGARGTRVSRRYIYPNSKIGFHAPGLTIGNRSSFSREEITSAFAAAVNASALVMSMLDVSQHDVHPLNFPLLRKILSADPSEMYYIDTLADAAISNVDILGYKEWIFSNKVISNLCDAGYLRAFGSHFLGSSYANLIKLETEFVKTEALVGALRADAEWRYSAVPPLQKKIDIPQISEQSSKGEIYYGAVSGYPGYQGHNFLCVISSQEKVVQWDGRAETSKEFRARLDYEFSLRINFYAYRFHEEILFDNNELAHSLLSQDSIGQSGGWRFEFVDTIVIPATFAHDVSNALNGLSVLSSLSAFEKEVNEEHPQPAWCLNASTLVESTICDHPMLSAIDIEIGEVFQLVRSDADARALAQQRLRQRNACGPDVGCLVSTTSQTLKLLRDRIR